MKLTPLDIYNKRFGKSFSLRAYNSEEVDDFIEHVGHEYEILYEQTIKLGKENKQYVEMIKRYKEEELKLTQTLIAAQDAYNRRKDEADREAKLIVEEARLKAQRTLDEAKLKIQERYAQYQSLVELEELFKVRFKTLLESHLKYLENMERDKGSEGKNLGDEEQEDSV